MISGPRFTTGESAVQRNRRPHNEVQTTVRADQKSKVFFRLALARAGNIKNPLCVFEKSIHPNDVSARHCKV